MNAKSYKDIEKIIYNNFNNFNDNEIETPIDPILLSESKGLEVRVEELEDSMSGFLVIKKTKKTIVVNKTHHKNRRRFTIAHELGHYMLHAQNKEESLFVDKKQVYNRNLKSSAGTIIQEIEANRFAASLLMPRKTILNCLKMQGEFFYEFSDDDNLIPYLANKYEVSKTAMTHRLSSLLVNGKYS